MKYGHFYSLSDFLGIIFKTGVILTYDWNNDIWISDQVNFTDNSSYSDFSKGVTMAGGRVETGFRLKLSTNITTSIFLGC